MEYKEKTKKSVRGGFSRENYPNNEPNNQPSSISSSYNVSNYYQPSYTSSPYDSVYSSQVYEREEKPKKAINGQFSPQKSTTQSLVKTIEIGNNEYSAQKSTYLSFQSTNSSFVEKPLFAANPELVFNRNTNSTECFVQQGNENSFAFAVTSAYLNTCNRIFGSPIPTFEECFQIADYNRGCPGEISTALNLLENRFKIGVRYEQTPKYQIPNIDAITRYSLILSFTTSREGWERIANGELLTRPEGPSNGVWHTVLLEAYDFKEDHVICKNSWGPPAKGRFGLRFSALHDFNVVEVYYTLESIPPAIKNELVANTSNVSEAYKGYLDGKEILFYEMDERTAVYDPFRIAERKEQIQGFVGNFHHFNYTWVGFKMKDWIMIKLNRPNKYYEIDLKCA